MKQKHYQPTGSYETPADAERAARKLPYSTKIVKVGGREKKHNRKAKPAVYALQRV